MDLFSDPCRRLRRLRPCGGLSGWYVGRRVLLGLPLRGAVEVWRTLLLNSGLVSHGLLAGEAALAGAVCAPALFQRS